MKRKLYIFLSFIIIGLFVFYLLSTGFPRKAGNSYPSVKVFHFHSTKDFYDFYAPQYYFNHVNQQKQTLSDINNIDIWYQESVDNYYSMVFRGESFEQDISYKGVEVRYSVETFTEDGFQKIMNQYELIDNDLNIYYDSRDGYVLVSYNHNYQDIIKVMMTQDQDKKLTIEEMKSIVYHILKDSIQLNQQNTKK